MRVYACLLAAIYRKFYIQILSLRRSILWSTIPCDGRLEVHARVQRRRPGQRRLLEVEAHVATYFWFVLLPTINGSPLTSAGVTNLLMTVVEAASGKGNA